MAAVGTVLSAAAPYLLGASAGLSVLSGALGAGQASQAAAASASAYEQQAALHEQQAAQSEKAAKNAAAQERDRYRRLASSQRANMGASGVDVNMGSALDVLADTDAEGELSAMQLLYSGELEAWNARRRAADARQGAGAARRQGGADAFSSLFGGAMKGLSTGLLAGDRLGWFDKTAGAGAAGAESGGPDISYTPPKLYRW